MSNWTYYISHLQKIIPDFHEKVVVRNTHYTLGRELHDIYTIEGSKEVIKTIRQFTITYGMNALYQNDKIQMYFITNIKKI